MRARDLVERPDLVTWRSIMCAYSFHGLLKESIIVFKKTLAIGLKPDQIAFLGILSNYSDGGLVNEGLHYNFPDSEHYTCLFHLVGLAGLVDKAFNIMPHCFYTGHLRRIQGACGIHGNLTLAERAAENLVVWSQTNP
ncbi:hypothetical protein PTKIN_Ptkin12aG0178700 [Pterospermum kingtungense]